MGRLKSVHVTWRRKSEYTRWTGWVDRGVGFASYHFRTLHLTIEWFPPEQSRTPDEDVRVGSSDESSPR